MHEAMLTKERVEREMGFANEIQKGFLPKSYPTVEGYEFWAFYHAAGQVGGDYYDFFPLPDGKMAVILGDVSGKGVPAALVMALAASAVRVALLMHPDDPIGAMNQINNSVEENTPDDRFITMAICIFDPVTHKMTIVNAGHMSPIIRRADGTIDEPADERVSGLPVGVMDNYDYESVDTELAPGERIVLFSDGISEAMNSKMEEYTMGRIRSLIKNTNEPSMKLGKILLKDVTKHVSGFKQSDDISLVVFGRG